MARVKKKAGKKGGKPRIKNVVQTLKAIEKWCRIARKALEGLNQNTQVRSSGLESDDLPLKPMKTYCPPG